MFKRRSGGIFLSAVALVCLTWLSTIELLRNVSIPKWGIAEVMMIMVSDQMQDKRLEGIEAQLMLAKEIERFRDAMRPFVKSQACKVWVGGK